MLCITQSNWHINIPRLQKLYGQIVYLLKFTCLHVYHDSVKNPVQILERQPVALKGASDIVHCLPDLLQQGI